MRTFTRGQLDEARDAWEAGDFSDEWRSIRHRAAMGGLIWPPSGTKWDSWDDDSPSQRAMLIRAIRETPKLLDKCVIGAKSWSQVIERLLAVRDDWRDELDNTDRILEWHKRQENEPRRSVMSLAEILKRVEKTA